MKRAVCYILLLTVIFQVSYCQNSIENTLENIGESIEQTAEEFADAVERMAENVGDTAEDVGDTAERSVEEAVDTTEDVAEDTADKVERTVERTADEIEKILIDSGVTESISDAVSDIFSTAEDALQDLFFAPEQEQEQESVLEVLNRTAELAAFVSFIEGIRFMDTVYELDLESQLFTIFAPMDEAIASATAMDDLTEQNAEDIIRYHIIPDQKLTKEYLQDGQILQTDLEGETIEVSKPRDETILLLGGLNEARILDVETINYDNGVVHVIDTVLLPDLED